MDQKQIVIGVHGLLNKSPQNTIEQWWYQALQEGLIKNCNSHSPFNFQVSPYAAAFHSDAYCI